MKQHIKTKWLEALRSGEYKQGQEHLRSDAGYCGLGVLCDVHAKENGGEWEGISGDRYRYLQATAVLPSEVIEWASLDNVLPKVTYHEVETPLSILNDSGMPFSEIADYIEASL